MKAKDIRFLAEWEGCNTILVALPDSHTDWDYILEEARDQYKRMVGAFVSAGCHTTVITVNEVEAKQLLSDLDQSLIEYCRVEYNDTWTRDYGPLTLDSDCGMIAADFGFNGWGLKFASDKDNLVNLHLYESGFFGEVHYANQRSYELEGGSVETDGRGTILTTTRCLTSPNRNGGLTKELVARQLEARLGCKHLLWLDYGALAGDDTDSHIDTLCRLAPHDTILFTGCRDVDDEHFEELLKMRAQLEMLRTPDGEKYNLIELPLPDAIYDEEGERLPASYANYLVTPEVIFMPTYNQPLNDRLACEMVKVAFGDQRVVPVECLTLIKQHGSLHCATMQLPFSIVKKGVEIS